MKNLAWRWLVAARPRWVSVPFVPTAMLFLCSCGSTRVDSQDAHVRLPAGARIAIKLHNDGSTTIDATTKSPLEAAIEGGAFGLFKGVGALLERNKANEKAP